MADATSQHALYAVLDRLRAEAPVRTENFGVGFAALIYLRWVDFQEAEQEAIAAFDDIDHQPILPPDLHWRTWHDFPPERLHTFLSRELPAALQSLGNARHNPLATQLHRITPAIESLARISADALARLVDWLAAQPFETPTDRRALLEVLDRLLLSLSMDKSSGQFRTPQSVVRLLIAFADPAAGDRIYDPCFGFGALLTGCLDYVAKQESRLARSGHTPLDVAGVELVPNVYVIGLTRLALAGVADPQLELGNSLERVPSNSPQVDGFDIVLADPPWGAKVDIEGVDHYPIPTKDASGLFIQHALSQLRPGGRAVLTVPPSVLFGSGAHQRLRQMLVEQHTVEAVVSLPEGTFLPYTSIRSNIVIIRRGGSTKSIRMVEVRREKGDPTGDVFLLEQLDDITRAVRSAQPTNHSWDVEVASLAKVDFDFTPKRRDQSGLELILASLPRDTEVAPLKACCQVITGRSIRSRDLQERPPKSNFEPSGQTLFPDMEREEINPQRPFEFADSPIPYVRIKDIQSGQATRGSSWLAPVAASSIQSKWKLRAGDILLSKSGTIGKAGLVRNGAVGAIAANGLFVLRVKEGILDPHYLLAYLQSAECTAWLDDRARGSGARHLSMGVIRELPVPVPPLQIQQRAVEQHRKFRVDILAYLAELLSEDQGEPIAASINDWVTRLLRKIDTVRQDLGGMPTATVLELLEDVSKEQCPLNLCRTCGKPYHLDFDSNHLDPPDDYSKGIDTTCLACWLDVGPGSETIESLSEHSPLVPWTLAFHDAISSLTGVSAIPDATGVLNVMQSSSSAAKATLGSLKGHLPNEEKARRLTRELVSAIDRAADRLLGQAKIVFRLDEAVRVGAGTVKIGLAAHNSGPLPLREVGIKFKLAGAEAHSARVPYLGADESREIGFQAEVAEAPTSLTVDWCARNLAGREITGSREVSIPEIEGGVAQARSAESLGASPYVCGDPVKTDRNDVFFGREALLDQIRRQIAQSGNVVLLEGNRRAGKSSILWHLEGKNQVPGWLGVYCSLQGTEGDNEGGVPTAEVFRGIAYEIAQSMRRLNGSAVLPDGTTLDADRKLGIARSVRKGISEESPFADFREYLELVLQTLAGQDLGLLLMLDEFDKLQEGIENGVTSPQVPENIRFLIHQYPRFSAILTGSRRLKRLREEYWSALFGLSGFQQSVTSLSKDAACLLITEPVQGKLSYAAAAVDLAYSLTAGQPYLLQCLCNRIFDIAAQTGDRSITVDHVRDGAEALVADNEHFASLWDYAKCDRRRFLLALLHREEEGPDPLQLGVIQEKLAAHGIEVSEETLISDLEELRELELVDLHGESTGAYYTLTIPMMGDWIEKQQDFDVLKSRARSESEDIDD